MESLEKIKTIPAEPEAINQGYELIAQNLKGFEVVDPITYRYAGQLVAAVKDLKAKIQAYFKPIKEQAYKTWREICDKEKAELSKLEPLEKKLSGQLVAYQMEEERKRREEEERLRAEARKREEELRLQMAMELEKQGRKEEAEQIVSTPVEVPAIKVESSVPKVEGISSREEWTFEIEDPNIIPREFLMPDEKKIRAYVKTMKEKAQIPGVKVYKTAIIIKRG